LSQNANSKKAIEPIIDTVKKLKYEDKYASINLALGTYFLTVEEKIDESIEYFEKTIIYAEKHSDLMSLWLGNYNLGVAHAFDLNFIEAEKLFKKCIDLSTIAGNTTGIIYSKATLGVLCLSLGGRIDEACALSRECMVEIGEHANSFLKAPVYTNHGIAQFHKGEIEDAENHLVKGMQYSFDTNNLLWGGLSRSMLSHIYLIKKDYDIARKFAKIGAEYLSLYDMEKIGGRWLLVLKNLAIAMKDKSRQHLSEAAQIYNKIGSKFVRSLLSAMVVKGFIYLDCFDDAVKWLERSISIHEKKGMKWSLAQDYNMYSALYKKRNKADKSLEYLTKAVTLFENCGADGWAQRLTKKC
jgi:tetratricopeptide (TPR) repeat protein